MITTNPDPRDPLGLAANAPLLAAWLDWMRLAKAGRLAPMTTPGHKQRQDLVGAVVAGDAPLYGALTPSSTPTGCWPTPRRERPRCGAPTGAGSR